MGILADMDAALDGLPPASARRYQEAFYAGHSALHAFWAERAGQCGDATIMVNGNFVRTIYRDVPVIPTDWPHGWELVAA